MRLKYAKIKIGMLNHALIKSAIFRVAVVTVDFFVLLLVLGSATAGGTATVTRNLIQIVMYWYHDRVWSHVAWGVKDGVESGRRALVKTVSYRIFATVQDFVVVFLFAGNLQRGLVGTVAIAFTNTVIFYLMERVWIIEEKLEKEKASEAEA